jgi:hypothetical protein
MTNPRKPAKALCRPMIGRDFSPYARRFSAGHPGVQAPEDRRPGGLAGAPLGQISGVGRAWFRPESGPNQARIGGRTTPCSGIFGQTLLGGVVGFLGQNAPDPCGGIFGANC